MTWTASLIDWSSDESQVLFNPRMDERESGPALRSLLGALHRPAHVWLATSGSTAQAPGLFKWVALSKASLLLSAQAVNHHLQSKPSDAWVHALPGFHVGGLGIHARAHLSGARVIPALEGRWDAHYFYTRCVQERGTLSALVPTQLHDLVKAGYRAPDSFRALIVGGGALAPALRLRARELGWNPLPSYGSTECSSQVATARLDDLEGKLALLPHFEAEGDDSGRLRFRGAALLTGFAILGQGQPKWFDPKGPDGWFLSEDLGFVDLERNLEVHGRAQDFIKVGGESVDLVRLDRIVQELREELESAQRPVAPELILIAVPDERLGHAIHAVFSAPCDAGTLEIVESLLPRLLPFERPRQIHYSMTIPRSPLGKVLRAGLVEAICPRLA